MLLLGLTQADEVVLGGRGRGCQLFGRPAASPGRRRAAGTAAAGGAVTASAGAGSGARAPVQGATNPGAETATGVFCVVVAGVAWTPDRPGAGFGVGQVEHLRFVGDAAQNDLDAAGVPGGLGCGRDFGDEHPSGVEGIADEDAGGEVLAHLRSAQGAGGGGLGDQQDVKANLTAHEQDLGEGVDGGAGLRVALLGCRRTRERFPLGPLSFPTWLLTQREREGSGIGDAVGVRDQPRALTTASSASVGMDVMRANLGEEDTRFPDGSHSKWQGNQVR